MYLTLPLSVRAPRFPSAVAAALAVPSPTPAVPAAPTPTPLIPAAASLVLRVVLPPMAAVLHVRPTLSSGACCCPTLGGIAPVVFPVRPPAVAAALVIAVPRSAGAALAVPTIPPATAKVIPPPAAPAAPAAASAAPLTTLVHVAAATPAGVETRFGAHVTAVDGGPALVLLRPHVLLLVVVVDPDDVG